MQTVKDRLSHTMTMHWVRNHLHRCRRPISHHHGPLRRQALSVDSAQLVLELLRYLLDEIDLSRAAWAARTWLAADELHLTARFSVGVCEAVVAVF